MGVVFEFPPILRLPTPITAGRVAPEAGVVETDLLIIDCRLLPLLEERRVLAPGVVVVVPEALMFILCRLRDGICLEDTLGEMALEADCEGIRCSAGLYGS